VLLWGPCRGAEVVGQMVRCAETGQMRPDPR
jgi:hypothetical protein